MNGQERTSQSEASLNPELLWSYGGLSRVAPLLFVASFLVNVTGLALPLTLLQIYDRVIPSKSYYTLFFLTVGGVLTALLLEFLARQCRSFVTGWVGARFDHMANCAAFRHLLHANILAFERDGAAVQMERLRAIHQVRDFYSGQALLALFDLPFVFLYLVLIGLIGGWLVAVPILVLLVFTLLAVYRGKRLREDIRRRHLLDDRRYSFIAETLGGIHTVKSMAMEAQMLRRYELLQEANVNHTFHGTRHSVAAVNLSAMFSQVSTVGMVAAGAVVVIDGQMTIGGLAACILLAGRSLQPLQAALGVWTRFQGLTLARSRLKELFALPSGNRETLPRLPEITSGSVVLEDVTFRYPGTQQDLFSGLSLSVKPGECVVITGDSGNGKSTLLFLLQGLLEPASGRVLVDGHDLSQFRREGLHRNIAYLPQRGTLFNGTILDNITMMDRSLEPQAIAIADALGLTRTVALLRHGFDTAVGDSVTDMLPAGITQSIAIARALVHDPRVVLFDEANISIDGPGDEVLRRHLHTLKGQRTLILVTHRPSLMKMADRVLTLSDGKLVEHAPEAAKTAESKRAIERSISGDPRPPRSDRGLLNLITRFTEPSDLAVALVGLLAALDWRGGSRQLADSIPHFSKSLDLTGLRAVMANLNYRTESFTTRMNAIDRRLLPCLFLPDNGNAKVLLLKEDGQGVLAFEANSVEVEEVDEKGRGPKGTALVFQRNDETFTGPEKVNWVMGVLLRFRTLFWTTLGLTVGVNILTLAPMLFVMAVYDRLIPSGDVQLVGWLMVGLVIVLAVDWQLRGLRAQILAYIAGRSEYIIGNSIFQRVLSLPSRAIERVTVGAQVSRFKDFESLREFFIGPVTLLVYEMPASLVYVAALAAVYSPMLLVLLAGIVVYALMGLLIQGYLARRVSMASRLGGSRQEFLNDALDKMRTLRITGAEAAWYERFREASGKAAMAEFRSQQAGMLVSDLSKVIGMLTGVSAMVICVMGAIDGYTTVGVVAASMMIMWRLIAPLQNGAQAATTLFRVLNSVRQVDNLMRLKGEQDITAKNENLPTLKGDIEFGRVSFRYSNDADPALIGASFTLPAGQVMAITGPNGAGKSTVLKLIANLYQPQAGSIRIDNIDVRQLDVVGLRSLISYVPQDCSIFYGTVAQNLLLAYPTASEEELEWAVRRAGLMEDILALPEGFGTRISEVRAEQLPTGFRQRLSLARAYLKPAPIMLFDEPGNGLDPEGDQRFMEMLNELRGKTTIVLVSQRPSHLRLADTVVYMSQGYIRSVGTYEQIRKLMDQL